MHGVGADTTRAVFAAAGLAAAGERAASRTAPTRAFPTVAFPNPEEPGATDLLKALAARIGADVAIAEDPDADRCAVVCGGRQLTGDEVGALLADWLLRRGRARHLRVVAGQRLADARARRGARACRRRRRRPGSSGSSGPARPRRRWCSGTRRRSGTRCRPAVARDKDGISAALAVALLAAELKADGPDAARPAGRAGASSTACS